MSADSKSSTCQKYIQLQDDSECLLLHYKFICTYVSMYKYIHISILYKHNHKCITVANGVVKPLKYHALASGSCTLACVQVV